MSYVKFTLKKIYRNKLYFIPFVLVLIFITFIYTNSLDIAYLQLDGSITAPESQIDKLENDIIVFKTAMEEFDESSENYKIAEYNLNMAQTRQKYFQQELNAIKNENWKDYYAAAYELSKINLKIFESDIPLYGEDAIQAMKLNIAYDEYMIHHNLKFDDRYLYIQGISHMVTALDDYLPIMLPLLLIFLTSSMYCSNYKDKLNITDILPFSRKKKQEQLLLSGSILGFFIVIFISIISIICGTIGNTFGSLDTPVLMYTLEGPESYVSFLSIVIQLFLLILLSILFIVNVTSIISTFIRRHILCLLITLIVILGGISVTTNIIPLYNYVHLLPTTYLSPFKVISGELLSITKNANINFFNGIIVLMIGNIVLLTVYHYIPIFRNKWGNS